MLLIAWALCSCFILAIADIYNSPAVLLSNLHPQSPELVGTLTVEKPTIQVLNSSFERRTVPPFPNRPKFDEASFPDQDQINLAARAILDCWRLVTAALQELSLPEPSPLFLRYFRAEQYEDIKCTLTRLHGINGFGPRALPDYLTVYWRYSSAESTPGTVCDEDPYVEAILFQVEGLDGFWHAELVICPYAYEAPSPPDINSVLMSRCQHIENRATHAMSVPGAAILHELLHWKEVTDQQGGYYIGDWNEHPLFAPDAAAYPINGYGAWFATELNRVHGKGRENADNYVWFAVEAFFERYCVDASGNTRHFDPPRPEDWDVEMPTAGDDLGASGGS